MNKASLRTAAGVMVMVLLVAGCRSTGATVDPDAAFGHRFEERTPEGREVIDPTPPPPGEEHVEIPALVTDVTLRQGDLGDDGRRPIDLRIEGSLPDACTHPHALTQHRMGHLIDLRFDIRRGRGAVCPQVVRHFVVYHELDERLPPGSYTLRLNDAVHPFQVFPDPEQEAR